jgi:hypothetical protein
LRRLAGALALAAVGAACAGTDERRTAAVARPATPEVTSTKLEVAIARGEAVELVTASRASLEASLMPVDGAPAVLVVHDFADGPHALVQRVDASGARSAVVAIERSHVLAARAIDDGATTELATLEGDQLCFATLTSEASVQRRGCIPASGHALVAHAAGYWLVAAAREDPPAPPATSPPKPSPRPPPSRPRSPRGPGKRRPAKQPPVDPVRQLFASGARRRVEIASIDPEALDVDTAIAPTFAPTGLTFREPMAGVGFIGAVRRGATIDLAFHEEAPPKGRAPQGRIGTATVDASGRLVPGSLRATGPSPLDPGALAELVEPRLFATEQGTLLLSQRSIRGLCEARLVAPFALALGSDAAACGLDPRSLVDLALARYRGDDPAPRVVPAFPTSERARRVFGQAPRDPGRTVIAGDRVFSTIDGVLWVASPSGEAASLGPALAPTRARVAWASLTHDGASIAATSAGLVADESQGAARAIPGNFGSIADTLDRSDVARAGRRFAVRIGDAWLASDGEARVLTPEVSAPLGFASGHGAALVGGRTRGLWIALADGRLAVSTIDRTGRRAPLGSHRAPITARFDAVARGAGGALVAGPSIDDTRTVAFAIDAEGRATTATTIELGPAARPRLVALPRGGALAVDDAWTRVVWLDDDARPLAEAAWPEGAAARRSARCADGDPVPARVPAPEPGAFVAIPDDYAKAACFVGDLAWQDDGALAWVGTLGPAPSARAVRVRLAPERLVRAPALPEARALPRAPTNAPAFTPPSPTPSPRCPPEMVLAFGALCVDRWEASLADATTGRLLSPDYPATPNLLAGALGDWATRRERQGDLVARALPLPWVAPWQRAAAPIPVATSREGVRPSAYVTGLVAREACERAGKRLCRLDEWRRACRGEAGLQHPYGPAFEPGACRVNDPVHPATRLHDSASLGHLDPRLGRVPHPAGGTVLGTTGSSPRCASRWGDDAIVDMVGNVDEWVDEPGGAFAGGFYARSTKSGCEALVTNHAEAYLDYSTGVRCCRDPAP